MKSTRIFDYYAFGHDFRLINNAGLKGYSIKDAKEILGGFFYSLNELDLQVTDTAAEELRKEFDKLSQEVESENGKDKIIPSSFTDKIYQEIRKIEAVLDAELKLKTAYVLTKKRYSIETLLKTPKELLGAGVYDKLSGTAKKDFNLACILIALDQPTGAAFHLMRTLEEQVKTLYFAFKKTKRLDIPLWGPMTDQLKKKKAPRPTDKLLTHLDGMRVHFRNPTQHPELFYTLDDAQDLLNQTITAVNMIQQELPV